MKKVLPIILIIFAFSIGVVSKDQLTISHSFLPYNFYTSTAVLSEDGNYAAITDSYKVTFWDLKGNKLGTFIDPKPYINPPNSFKYWNPNRTIYTVSFLPDNRHAAISVYQRKIHIVNLNGKIVQTIDVPAKKMSAASKGWSPIKIVKYFPNGNRVITYEPTDIDVVVRDKNFRMIKRIKLMNGSLGFNIIDIKVHPSGKYFAILQDTASPSKDGWNSLLKLYDSNGNFVRDLETDKPGRISTKDGRFKRTPFKPKRFVFSPDGKYVVYLNDNGYTDSNDPLGRTYKDKNGRDIKVVIQNKIRRTEIATGKQYESWILDKRDISFKQINYSPDAKKYIGIGSENIFEISFDGKVQKIIPNPKFKAMRRNKEYEFSFSAKDHMYNRYSKSIFAYLYQRKKGIVVYDLKGKMLSVVESQNISPKKIHASHHGEFICFEIDRAKKSFLFDTKKNKIEMIESSVFFDNKNKKMILSEKYDKKVRKNKVYITINGKTESYLRNDFKPSKLILLPTQQIAYFDNGFTLFTHDGEAIRRYPKASIGLDTAIDPNLKYYVEPNTWAKTKNVLTFDLNGNKIRQWYLGAFFTFAYVISPDGNKIAAGHDNAGYLQVWDKNGKMLHRISDLHSGQVRGIAMTKGGRYLMSSEEDGIIRIRDLVKKSTLTMTIYENNGFIASDDQGRFDCSENMMDSVSIYENNKSFKGSQRKKNRKKGLVGVFLLGK